MDWACAKVSASGSTPDEELRDALRAKLADQAGGVRYAAIAAHAQGLGRPRLATLLLEHETRAGEHAGLGDAADADSECESVRTVRICTDSAMGAACAY